MEEKKQGWDPTDRRADGEKHADMETIAKGSLGLSCVLCNTNF